MNFVLILWFVSQSAISATSAQFELMEECQQALRSVQAQFPGPAVTVGGGCYRATAGQ